MPKKIDVEVLIEKAWDWWHETVDYTKKEDMIIKRYMRAKGINNKDVDW